MSEVKRWWVRRDVPWEADAGAIHAPDYRVMVSGNDYDSVVAERDNLKAAVARVRGVLAAWDENSPGVVNINAALSESSEPLIRRKHEIAGCICECVAANQRGTQGDRRKGERRRGYGFAPDRRKVTRRRG